MRGLSALLFLGLIWIKPAPAQTLSTTRRPSVVNKDEMTVLVFDRRPSAGGAAEDEAKVLSIPLGLRGGTNTNKSGTSAGAYIGAQGGTPFWFAYTHFNYATENVLNGDENVFGTFLLNPGTEALAFRAGGNYVPNACINLNFLQKAACSRLRDLRFVPAFYGNFGWGFADWRADVPLSGGGTQARSARGGVWYMSWGLQLAMKEQLWGANRVRVGLEGGYTARYLSNQILQDTALLAAAIGTTKTDFRGKELTFFASLNDVKPFIRTTWFDKTDAITGFSDVMTFMGLDVMTPLFIGGK